jgi:hypothetical protein
VAALLLWLRNSSGLEPATLAGWLLESFLLASLVCESLRGRRSARTAAETGALLALAAAVAGELLAAGPDAALTHDALLGLVAISALVTIRMLILNYFKVTRPAGALAKSEHFFAIEQAGAGMGFVLGLVSLPPEFTPAGNAGIVAGAVLGAAYAIFTLALLTPGNSLVYSATGLAAGLGVITGAVGRSSVISLALTLVSMGFMLRAIAPEPARGDHEVPVRLRWSPDRADGRSAASAGDLSRRDREDRPYLR